MLCRSSRSGPGSNWPGAIWRCSSWVPRRAARRSPGPGSWGSWRGDQHTVRRSACSVSKRPVAP